MQTISVLRRVTLAFVLVLTLLLIGGSSHAPTIMAQQRTCYRLTKTITCADDVNRDYCQSSRDLILGKLPDGSVIGQVKGGTREDSCNFKYTDGFLLFCPSGTAQWGGNEPPPYMCSDQEQSFRAIADARGQFSSVSGRFWFSPAGAFQARPGGVGSTGGLVPPGSRDPFTYIEATEDKNSGSGTQNSGFIKVLPARDLDKFSIGIVVSGFGKRPGGNATVGVGFGVEYVYERLSAGQEPPSSSTGSSASTGPSSSTRPSSSTGPGSSTATGATNITIPMPPFNQAEPYTDTPGMAIQAAQRRVGVGELVNVPVWLIKGNNVANINYELTYNASVARPEGTIRKGYLLDNAFFSANPNTSGIIRIGFAQATGVSGTGPVTYIPFRAVGKAGDRTPLSLAVTTINNPPGATLAIDRIHGEIVIMGTDGLTPGDCEGTGKALSGLDVMCALEMSVKLIPVRLVMDMDNSRDVTSRDAAIIAQTILEIRR